MIDIDRLEAAEKERDALRTEVQTWQEQAKAYWLKIEAMERQEPVGAIQFLDSTGTWGRLVSVVWVPMLAGSKLYALPGAKGD